MKSSLVEATALEMSKTGEISGVVKRGDFIPNIFAATQRKSCYSFFTQNHYIEHSMGEKMQIRNLPQCVVSWCFPSTRGC